MYSSPPILVRIEWADSQGRVTASWLAAHFNFLPNCDLNSKGRTTSFIKNPGQEIAKKMTIW